LNRAAEGFVQYRNLVKQLCITIKGMKGGLRFEGEDTEENRQWREVAMAISTAIEAEFHKVLDPYVERLEEIDKTIVEENLPKPSNIILPGDNN
jgi:hypothetical protein